jgi:peptidoglycan/LPS O-acetylase OafA/YrhL
MISGYVIPWSIRGRSVGEFALARAIRLYPTYWLCAALLLFLPPLLGDWRFMVSARDALVNVTMVAPWFGAAYIDAVFWSLAIELQFYLLVAAAVAMLGFERLPKALLGWAAIGAGTSVLAIATGTRPVYLGGTYYMYFCFGAACYFLHHIERSRTVWALAVLSLPLMLAHSLYKASVVAAIYHVPMSSAVVAGVLAAGGAAVYFSSAMSQRLRATALVSFIGGLTYPLYLLHENIGYALMNTLFSPRGRWLGLGLTVLLCLAASAAVYVWFDLPVRRLLRRALRQQLGFRH